MNLKIAVTSITPLAGRLCQIFSPRNYIFASAILQCVGLLITALASTLRVFILGRVITGAGSAAVTPVAFIVVTELTSRKRRGLFFGLVNTGYTVGVSLGAIIAGVLEPLVGWRAVFWLQIPLSLTAVVTVYFAIPLPSEERPELVKGVSLRQKLRRIDYFGVLTLVSAVVLLLYGLSMPKIPITPVILSMVMLVLFLFVEARYAREPLIPISVLKARGTLLTFLSTMGFMMARWAVLFYTPVYALAVRGWSPASAGLMLLPTNGGFALGGLLAGWIHIRRAGSFYFACLITYLVFSIVLFLVSQISTPASNIWLYVVALFTNGLVTGAALNYTLAHVLHLAPPDIHVIVIPLLAMFRGLSASFGSAIGGGIFARVLQSTLEAGFASHGLNDKEELVRRLLGTPALVRSLEGVDREVAVEGYHVALSTLFTAGAGLALIMTVVQAGTGWNAPVEKPKEDDTLEPVTSREPMAG